MARITCPHCSEKINLATTNAGRYQCPYCDKFFNIAKKQTKPKSVEIRTNSMQTPNNMQTPEFNPDDVVLPKSTMFWHNTKLVILTPPGFFFFVYGLINVIQGYGDGFRILLGLIILLLGSLLMIPAFYNSRDVKNKKTEYMLKATNQIMPGQTITNPSRSLLSKILVTLFIMAIIGLLIYVIIILIGYLLIILALGSLFN